MNATRQPTKPARTPYFLRAMHEWISDAGLTPQIIVDAGMEGVHVPSGYNDDQGRVVLNIGFDAVRELELTNEAVLFKARFGGTPHSVYVPIAAIQGVFARESGEGIVFNEEVAGVAPRSETNSLPSKGTPKPALKIVK